MQQRFCTCGCSVWVQYMFSRLNCNVVFWRGSMDSGERVSRCPSCGEKLNIDNLN